MPFNFADFDTKTNKNTSIVGFNSFPCERARFSGDSVAQEW